MHRRPTTIVLLAAVALLGVLTASSRPASAQVAPTTTAPGAGPTTTPAAPTTTGPTSTTGPTTTAPTSTTVRASAPLPSDAISSSQAAGAVSAATTVTQSWTRDVVAGQPVSTSSPVLVANSGNPFVAVGDNGGNVRAYDLDTGTPVPGWGSTSVGFVIRAPLSSDGSSVYVPVAQDGIDNYPQYKKFSASGALQWNSRPGMALPAAGGFLLSGLSLARIDGAWRGFGGSSGHWVYGVDASNGAKAWEFRNADSTMATPALADLYGSGRPQVITSNDTSREFPTDYNGGILRIFTHDGKQICSATQLVTGDTYAESGYNNSSPAVAEIGGQPLIVFGSTGPVQGWGGGNQVVAYDSACNRRWSSIPLAAQAGPSPTFADVLGTGTPQVIQVVAVPYAGGVYPRIYVLDAATGQVVLDSSNWLANAGGQIAYPPSSSITTADVNNDGAQDLFVPGAQGAFRVLNGKTLDVLATIPTNMAIQNTPIVTPEGGSVRVTIAGYTAVAGGGIKGIVSSYLLSGASMGANGWTTFGNNPQRTGLAGTLSTPRNQLIEDGVLAPGGTLRSSSGAYVATMQPDGNFVIRRTSDNSVTWQTNTSVAGSSFVLRGDGNAQVRGTDNVASWKSGVTATGTERVVLGNDGVLTIQSGSWTATRRLTSSHPIWSSTTGPIVLVDRLGRGSTLVAGRTLTSQNGAYQLAMQADGNLVLYGGAGAIWESGTHDSSGQALVAMQADGNLVIYGAGGRVLRNFGLAGRGGVTFVIESDGILRVADAAGTSVWQHDRVIK